MKLLVAGVIEVGQVATGAVGVAPCATLRWRKPSAPTISEPAGLAEVLLPLLVLPAGTVVSFTFGDMLLELLLLLLLLELPLA